MEFDLVSVRVGGEREEVMEEEKQAAFVREELSP